MPPRSSTPSGEKPRAPASGPPLVVVVDDDPRLLALLATEVEGAAGRPLEIQTFTAAERALERLRSAPRALVLLDLDLPGMSGLALLEAIGRLPVTHRVVIVTVHSATTHRARCEALGADGFVEKNRVLEELPALLERFLREDSEAAATLASGKKS